MAGITIEELLEIIENEKQLGFVVYANVWDEPGLCYLERVPEELRHEAQFEFRHFVDGAWKVGLQHYPEFGSFVNFCMKYPRCFGHAKRDWEKPDPCLHRFHGKLLIGSSASEKVDEAGMVGAVEIGKLAALEAFNSDLATTPKVPFRLSGRERAALNKYVGTQVMTTNKRVSTNDHLLLESARHLLREDLDSRLPHNTDVSCSLHIGASVSDYRRWHSHAGAEFLFGMREDKDVARNAEDLMMSVGNRVKNSTLPALSTVKGNSTRLRISGISEAFKVVESGSSKRMHLSMDTVKKNTHGILMFPDSLYDMTEAQFAEYWEHTGATVGYAILFVPDPLLSEFSAPSTIYNYEEYFPVIENVQSVIDQIWPSVLLLTPALPLPALAGGFQEFLRVCFTTGWKTFSEFLHGLATDNYPVEMFLGAAFDISKIVPIYKHLLSLIKPLLRRLLARIRVTWKNGFSNGYDHKVATWQPWATKSRFAVGTGFVDSEVVSVRGEMRLLRFWRSTGTSPIVRTLDIPRGRRGIKLLDIEKSFKTTLLGGAFQEDSYFLANEGDYQTLVNFFLAEPDDSIDLPVFMTTLNRIRGGLSLASNVLVEPMSLDEDDVFRVAINAFFYVSQKKGIVKRIVDSVDLEADYKSNIRKYLEMLGKVSLAVVTGGMAIPIFYLVRWLCETRPTIEFVKRGEKVTVVQERARRPKLATSAIKPFSLCFAHGERKTELTCFFCQLQAIGAFSESGDAAAGQRLICEPSLEENSHDLSFTSDEAVKMAALARDAETAHTMLGATKLLPKINSFKHWWETNSGGVKKQKVIIDFVYGGPGTGKTEIIKAVADRLETEGHAVGILAPFKDLQTSYITTTVLGKKTTRTFNAQTTWYGTDFKSLDWLIVDETSAVDWQFIKALSVYTGAQRILLVGDSRQTHLNSAAGEGVDPTNPLSGLNWDAVSKHELTINYRLDPWRVKWCNDRHGYRMRAAKTGKDLCPILITQADYKDLKTQGKGATREFVFSHKSGEEVFGQPSGPGMDINLSVRSSQGATVKGTAAVSVFSADLAVMEVPGMLLVAVTRSTGQVYIVYPGPAPTDPAVSYAIRELGIDSDEEKARISKSSWPVIPAASFDHKLNEKDRLLNEYISAKASFGEVEILKDDQMVDKLVVEFDDPIVHSYNLGLLNGLSQQDAIAWDFYRSVFHMCFFDMVREAGITEAVGSKIRSFLDRAYSESLGETDRMTILPGIEVSDGKTWLPLEPMRTLLEGEGLKFIEYHNKSLSYITNYTIGDVGPTAFYNAVIYSVGGNHVVRLPNKLVSVDSPSFASPVMKLLTDIVDGKVVAHHKSSITRKKMLKTNFVGATFDRYKVPEFSDKHRRILQTHAPLLGSYKTVEHKSSDEFRQGAKLRLGTDGYRLAKLVDPSGAFSSPMLNVAAPFLGPTRKTNVRVEWSGFIVGRTPSGRMRRPVSATYHSVTPGMGNHFNNTPVETLIAAQRIGVQKGKPRLSNESRAFARQIAQEAYREYWRPRYILAKEECNAVILRAMRDIKSRNYHGRSDAEENKHQFTTRLTCSNKDQFKPMKNGKLNLGKGGQVLLQSPPRVNMEFMAWMRLNGKIFKDALKPDVFMDDYETETSFRTRLSRALAALPDASQVAIADGEEWDSQQNECTLEIEKEMCRLFGATDPVIEAYFHVRGNLPFIMFGIFKGTTNGEKGSGFLDTKLGNTKLTIALSNKIFSGLGPKVVACKGDDYLRVQVGLAANEDMRKKIKLLLGMAINVSIGRGGEFCGNSVFRKGIYTSITRATMKCLASKAKTYHDFTEHQISWRDKIKDISRAGIEETVAFSAYAEKVSENYVRTCLAVLNSMSHVGKLVWEGFPQRKNPLFHLPDARSIRLL